jgi:molybdopterin-containing oxidoreductase family membrane subunit
MRLTIAGRTISLDRRGAQAAVATAGGAVRAEVASQPRHLKRWFAGLTVVVLLGAASAALTVTPGAEVFGTTPPFEWGILIASYVFLVVTTSGLCLVNSLGMVFGIDRFKPLEMRHVVLALVFLVAGFGVIALDLHYPLRLVFGVVLSPSPSSPMWWMGTVYACYLAVLVFELLANLSPYQRLAHASCVIATAFAIVAPVTLGLVFSSLVSRPFWQGSAAPVYLILTAILSGASVLGIVFALVNRLRLPGHGPDATAVIVGVGRVLLILLAVVMGYTAVRTILAVTVGTTAEREAVAALVLGPLGPQSWLVRVGIGLVAPLLILLWPTSRRAVVVFAASCLVIVGMFFDRFGFVAAGQIASSSSASGVVAEPYAAYTPSLTEIGIVVGAIAVVGLVYTLAERFLDLSSPGGSGDVHGVRASMQRSILRRTIGATR